MDLRDIRSLLFVPGHRGDRFAKAAASGADVVCVDLEDAVAPADRAAARAQVLQFLAAQPAQHRFGLRINAVDTPDGERDLAALAQAQVAPAFVLVAKTESAAQLCRVAATAPASPLIALVETALGLLAADEIARAHPQLQALMLGGADLCADLGCSFAWEPLLYARSRLVAAAAQAKLATIDVPWLGVADAAGAEAEARRVAALGYSAKALIHPAQVAPVHAGLMPAAEAVESARRIVQAAAGSAAAVLVDGRMVDRPVVLAAERLLRRAGH